MYLDNRDIKNIMLLVTIIDVLFMTVLLLPGINEKNSSAYKHSTLTSSEVQNDVENIEKSSDSETTDNGIVMNIVASDDVVKNEDYYGTRDSSMENIFSEKIIGKYKINDFMEYKFGMNGIYSGFFDDNHTNVSGYCYEIVVFEDEAKLNIYNAEKDKIVTYELLLIDDTSIALYYPSANLKIILKE